MKKSILALSIFLSLSTLAECQTPQVLRVNIDANGNLVAMGYAQTAPISSCLFSNCRLAVDASGNLKIVLVGGTFTSPLLAPDGTAAAPSYSFASDPNTGWYWNGGQGELAFAANGVRKAVIDSSGGLSLAAAATFGFGNSATIGTTDTILARDAANTLAQRNGTTAQTTNIYNTYTSGSNFERGFLSWISNVFTIGTETTGGTARALTLMAAGTNPITFNTNGTNRWNISSNGHLLSSIDGNASIGALNANRPGTVYTSQSSLTQGSGTGISVQSNGELKSGVYKVVISYTAFTCAALTCDVTIGTLPANTWLFNATANLTQTFVCAATCTTATLSIVLGKGSGGAEYLASLDADAATGIFGDADAEMGTLMTRAAAIQGGTFTSGSQAVVMRLTSGTGNIGTGAATNLNAGSITFWLRTVVLP